MFCRLNCAGTYELFFKTIYFATCLVTSTSPKSISWLLTERYGYLPTALNLTTLCAYPSTYKITVPTITVACFGVN